MYEIERVLHHCMHLSFTVSHYSITRQTHRSSCPGLLQPDGAGPEPVDLQEDQDFEEYGTFENDDQPREEEERTDETI